MAALDIVSLDTATPQLEVPGAADTYAAPRALAISPVALTGSAATPALDISQTWNTTGTPTGIRLSVTDTASNAASNLMDLGTGGGSYTSQFSVRKDGAVGVKGLFGATGVGGIAYRTGGGNGMAFFNGASPWGAVTTSGFRFQTSIEFDRGNVSTGNNVDAAITCEAAQTLAQRNGTNAQTFRLYGTYTAADNFQRLNAVVTKTASGALSGASVTLSAAIPDGAVVVGVTSRVSTLITGATGYQIGTVADPDRWGDITGTAVGTVSKNSDWTVGTVECFTSATDIVLTANGSNFTAGAIEVCVHYLLGDAD